LDLKPPQDEAVEFVAGSVADPEAIRRALQGVDAFIWLVMQRGQGGAVTTQDIPTIVDNYEVNAKGLHLLLFIAQQLGITRGVYTSTMSVHYRKRPTYPAEELVPLDTPSVYGLTKGFGELICQYFARWFDMNLIALRITGPRARQEWLEERRHPRRYRDGTPEGDRLFVTDEEDLANAYLAALQAVQVGHGRFDAVFIAGDEAEEQHNLSKAGRLLGWAPQAQRLLQDLPEG
ncbi:MAG TPA: NAD-dependent epimerase/dehydratase family protein, partial [Chloroflexota bacterium]|nr:NAD-dependent epimerase/dehydratase family protein [Chloroflexota bacterium]